MTTYSWKGGDGLWTTAADWDPTGVPTMSDDAVVSVAGVYTVTVASQDVAAADELTIGSGATIAIDGFLDVGGTLDNGGAISIADGGALDIGGAVTTAELGNLDTAAGSAIDFAGGLDNSGAALDLASGTLLSGTIKGGTVEGSVGIADNGILTFNDNVTFEGAGGVGPGAIAFSKGFFDSNSSLAFVNETIIANLTISAADESVIDFVGDETLSVSSAIDISGFSGDEYIDGFSTNVKASDNFSNAGTIQVTSGQCDISVDERFDNSGLLASSGPSYLEIAAIAFVNTGTLSIGDGSAVYFEEALTTAQLGTVVAASDATLSFENLENSGATLVADDESFLGTITGGTIEGSLEAVDVLTLAGSPDFVGARGVGLGQIALVAGEYGLDAYDDTQLNFEGPETISNVRIDMANNDMISSDDDVTLARTAVIDVLSSDNVIYETGSGNVDTLTIQAAIIVSDEASLEFGYYYFDPRYSITLAGAISGPGTLVIGLATVTFDPGASLSIGRLREGDDGDDATISIDEDLAYAGAFDQQASSVLTIDADDAFTLTGGSTLAGSVAGAGALVMSGGTAALDPGANLSIADWSISGAQTVVGLDGNLAYAGVFTLQTGATVKLGANLSFSGTSYLDAATVNGADYFLTAGQTFISGLTIGGDVVWLNHLDALQSGAGVTLDGAARFVNSATGVYDLTGDSGIASATAIDNFGVIERTSGAGVSVIAADIINDGEIAIAAGEIDLSEQLLGAGAVEVDAGATLAFGAGAGAAPSGRRILSHDALELNAGSTLALQGENLWLTRTADLAGDLEGADRLITSGATSVDGFTIGGGSIWVNAATATQSGGDLTIRETFDEAACLYNVASGVYDITDDSGVGGTAGAAVNNAGLFEKTGAGASAIAANVYNSGTISAATGTLDFQAALWGPGTAEVSAGATLEVDGVVGSRDTLAFSGSGGEIALDDLDVAGANLFHGAIRGFGAGDMIDIGAPFGSGATAKFTENGAGTGGVLELIDGPLSAGVAMIGNYTTANFVPRTDNHGGTLLTFHAT